MNLKAQVPRSWEHISIDRMEDDDKLPNVHHQEKDHGHNVLDAPCAETNTQERGLHTRELPCRCPHKTPEEGWELVLHQRAILRPNLCVGKNLGKLEPNDVAQPERVPAELPPNA
eukprot:CAMPEP_0176019394 /NCGR_PEP_ID=MMETSP0120_2-20121206/9367_1 /TAXON_ID=160619 /ORGANISM="Kryptoperidinium foliaceum, Strain CCMP 1326" /LENGTH=114 /DNA_ID=CAMNT_0017352467 /DNA_START=59 /DNA_END=399 /DNA_ORIENTATION=+